MEKGMILQKKWVVCLLAMVCCALWGSAHPCIKIGYEIFSIGAEDSASQILFAGCRFLLAGALALFLGSLLGRKILLPTKAAFGKICRLAMVQTVMQYLFFYMGLAHTTGVKSSIINGVNVFISIFVACFVFHQEKITGKKLLGCLLGFAGVVLVNLAGGTGIDFHMQWNGEGALLMATVAYALSSAMMKQYSKEENPVMLSGCQFMLGGLIMIVCGCLLGGRIAPSGTAVGAVGMLLYLAFISAVAYSLWGILLKYNPVSKVTVFGFMNPVFGVALSAILLKETNVLGAASVTALLLICSGIYIVNK